MKRSREGQAQASSIRTEPAWQRLSGSQATGFTLIELMITVTIVAILAAIAYPAYTSYVQRGKRSEAQAALMESAGFMERYYSTNFRYSTTAGGSTGPTLPVPCLPRNVSSANCATDTRVTYTLSLSSVADAAFTLQAVPQNAQANDSCGTLTLNHQGTRGAAATDCWQR